MSAISIVMPCYNRAHDLRRVLEAYDQQDCRESFELIAVDDGSKDETYKVLSSFHPVHYTLRVERQEKNSGPAAARNRAIQLANSPLILFVGDDILPDCAFVQGHLDAHARFPQHGVAILGKVHWPADLPVNTLMRHIDGVGAQQFSYDFFVDGQEYDFRHLYTANISLKTEFLRAEKKWFDTDFVFAAFEDVELAYRLSKRGLRIIYQASICAGHYHYHTIWSFFDRQCKSGQMAVVLTYKHPKLNYLFRTPLKQLVGYTLRPHSFSRKYRSEDLTWVENLALQITSYYEWNHHVLLDNWYLVILQYAYFAGILQGVFKKSRLSRRVRAIYCLNFLVPKLLEFIALAHLHRVPLPEYLTEQDVERIRQLVN